MICGSNMCHCAELVAVVDRNVQAGSVVFAAKKVEHRFHAIEEELTLLVFFALVEYSKKP